jgi:tryptophan synthase alpha chain
VSPNISSDALLLGRDPLAGRFAAWRSAGRRALIPYMTAGYPHPAATLDVLDNLVSAGADIIELGVPFSDPVADGPTIQRASQRAIEQGTTLDWTLGTLREFRRRHDTAIVLFTYLNPILRYGVDAFLVDAADAGAQGILVTDLPVGADARLEEKLEESALAHVRLIAPTTPPARARLIAARAQGFLYYISRTGVTGATRALRADLPAEIESLRAVSSVPIAIGFGISTAEQAAEVARVADGVVVGSALLDALDRGGLADMWQFLRSLREGMDAVAAESLHA